MAARFSATASTVDGDISMAANVMNHGATPGGCQFCENQAQASCALCQVSACFVHLRMPKVKGIEPRYLPEQDTIVPFDGAPTPGAPPVTKGWVFPIVTPYHKANAQLVDILDGWCKAVFGIDDYFGSIAMVLKETVQQLAIR